VPYPPARRLPDGRVDFIADILDRDTMIADHAELAQRIAVERLADAAGCREG
jgi:hypothetical protein